MANRNLRSNSARRLEGNRTAPSHSTNKRRVASELTESEKMLMRIQIRLSSLLGRAARSCAPKDVSWAAVDLASLWEVSRSHLRHIRLLLRQSYPKDRERIERLLTEIQVNLLSQGAEHMKTLQRSLPRIVRATYSAKSH